MEEKKRSWEEVIIFTIMTQGSYQMTQPHSAVHVCKLSCTPTYSNGRGNMSFTSKHLVLGPATEGYTSMVYLFIKEDYNKLELCTANGFKIRAMTQLMVSSIRCLLSNIPPKYIYKIV